MKLYFQDAGNWAFMKNMQMPGDIQNEIEAAVRRRCAEGTHEWRGSSGRLCKARSRLAARLGDGEVRPALSLLQDRARARSDERDLPSLDRLAAAVSWAVRRLGGHARQG